MSVRCATAAVVLLSGALYADDFATAVSSTHPIAYFRLDSASGKSEVGAATYQAQGGAGSEQPGPPVGLANNHFVKLNGRDGWVKTTQAGGVGLAASIMAWVNLESLPSMEHRIFYVAGESENGNDLDIQFEPDNVLRFFTASGGNVSYAPPAATLVNHWHMIVVTMDAAAQSRVIFWDGKQVAADRGGGRANKTAPLSMGASTVFSGRYFKGGIAEVALWNHALTAKDVAAIYAAASSTGSAGAPTGTGPFASTAKVEVNDAHGPIKLKREEEIALMFLTSIQQIEAECQDRRKSACTMEQMLAGPTASDGSHLGRLKFDPKTTDPNYTYTVGAVGVNWEAHANAKKPGLLGFYFLYTRMGGPDVSFNASGTAGPIDTPIGDRGITGDLFIVR